MADNFAEIQSALFSLPSHDAGLWIKLGAAIYSELGEGGFDLWNEWSASADNYQEKAVLNAWKGFRNGTKARIGSLFYEASDKGKFNTGWKASTPYTPPTPEQHAIAEAERLAADEEAAQKLEEQRAAAAVRSLDKWKQSADTINAQHPYIVKKGIIPLGAKQFFDKLILPIRANGVLVNVQLIDENGGKLFGTGGQIKGASLLIGKLSDSSEAILCEGWATGCTLHQAMGLPVVVAFACWNLPIIA